MVGRELVKTLKLLLDYASFGSIPFETFRKVFGVVEFCNRRLFRDSNGWKHDTLVKFINCDKGIICKRKYCLILKQFILNNNLFYLQ